MSLAWTPQQLVRFVKSAWETMSTPERVCDRLLDL